MIEYGRITRISNGKVPTLWSSLRCCICSLNWLQKHMVYLKYLIHFKVQNLVKPSVFYKLMHFILLEMLKANNLFLSMSLFPGYRIAIEDEIMNIEARLPNKTLEIVRLKHYFSWRHQVFTWRKGGKMNSSLSWCFDCYKCLFLIWMWLAFSVIFERSLVISIIQKHIYSLK